MNTIIFWSIFIPYLLAYSALIYALSRYAKSDSTVKSPHAFGVLTITFTLIATQLGGGMLLGSAQEAYNTGLCGIFYALSIILGFLILGLGVAGRIQNLNVATTAQLFQTVYQAPELTKIASLLSILTLSGLFISQIVGSRSLLCSLDITDPFIFVCFWLLIISATALGGLKNIIRANFVQVSYIFMLFSGIFIYCLSKESFPIFCIPCLESLHESIRSLDTSWTTLATTLVMPALYCLIEQDVAQRFFAARNKSVAVTAAMYAGILFFLFALIPVYFGIKAKVFNLSFIANASPLLPAIEFLTNDIVAAFAACGVLTAITSTANSLLCAVTSNITQDFQLVTQNKKNRLTTAITIIVGTLCLIISFYMPTSLIHIIINSYAVSVVCLLVPLLFAYYNKSLPKQAAVYAIFGGAITYACMTAFSMSAKEPIALACSLLGFFIGRYKQRLRF